MASLHVIKISHDEPQKGPILVHIRRKDTNALDLDLVATDGDSAFKGKVREKNLKKLRSKTYEGSDDEWQAILRQVFISRRDLTVGNFQKQDLEVVCTIKGKDPEARLVILVRTQIEDISQRLGSIELKQTANTDEIDLFGWAAEVIDERDILGNQINDEKSKLESANTSIASLQTQLADLVKAKAEHETQLLSNFSILLNEKKLKIRNQQRALETGIVDQKKIEALEQVIGKDQNSSSATRPRKRAAEDEKDNETDESDAFEKMDMDENEDIRPTMGSSQSGARSETPSVISQDEDEHDSNRNRPPSVKKGSNKPTNQNRSRLPPPRTLPIQKSSGSRQKPQSQEVAGPSSQSATAYDEETASEDDEL